MPELKRKLGLPPLQPVPAQRFSSGTVSVPQTEAREGALLHPSHTPKCLPHFSHLILPYEWPSCSHRHCNRKIMGRSERVASLPGTSSHKKLCFCVSNQGSWWFAKLVNFSLPGTCLPVASLEYEKKNQSDCVARVSAPLHKIPSNKPHKTSPTLCVLAAKTTPTPTKSSQM